jgi:hypothetical protein
LKIELQRERFLVKDNNQMFAITGITGTVGGEVARNLLAANQRV